MIIIGGTIIGITAVITHIAMVLVTTAPIQPTVAIIQHVMKPDV
jgi:hypothetical protein